MGPAFKSPLLLAALGAIAGTASERQTTVTETQLANRAAASAPASAPLTNPALASAIAQWKALRETDMLPFASYADFLLLHPGWPGEAGLRRAAERQAATGQPGDVVAFFDRYPPQSAAAGVRYAMALASAGRRDQAADAARAAWRRGALSDGDEALVFSNFPGALTAQDQDARMDTLLWQGATASATRQLAFVSPGRRDLFAARLALRSNAPEAATFATADASAFTGDAGFIADRVIWLTAHGAAPTARQQLAHRPALTAPPADLERWYKLLLAQARAAAADGDLQAAYDIAHRLDDALPPGADVSAMGYGVRDAYTDLAWLAARTAQRNLGRPVDAAVMFERYAGGSPNPTIRSKGLYWAARAEEAGGQPALAQAYLTRSAAYRDLFYGQLAAERLGRPLAPPPAFAPRPADPITRAAFDARETVQAARFLGQIGDWQDQSLFVREIALQAHSDADHVLADELSVSLGRPDLAVMIGRSAVANGLDDYSLLGFPSVSVPTPNQSDWTIIHAIARQESQFDRQATSRTGAKGLMQLMPGAARDSAAKLGLTWDPAMLTSSTDYNIQLGDYYFQHLFGLYGSYPLAVAAYNAGPGNVNRWLAANGDPRMPGGDMVEWIEAIPFSETRNYVQRVLENAVVYDLISPAHSRSQGAARLSWYLGKTPPG